MNKVSLTLDCNDIIAMFNYNEYSYSIISSCLNYRINIAGTWFGWDYKNTVIKDSIPVFKSYEEMLNCTYDKTPNVIIIFNPPSDDETSYLSHECIIMEEINKIIQMQDGNIKKIIIITLSLSNKHKKEIIKNCLHANISIEFIESFHAAYILKSPEKMPWYNKELDSDLKEFLIEGGISEGKFLDIGTGAGDQAIALSNMGFNVTATDISEFAFISNKTKYNNINFLEDDILNTVLRTKFNYILDRGCFHNLPPKYWGVYINQILRLLDSKGLYFLKCRSNKDRFREMREFFDQDRIEKLFGNYFSIKNVIQTTFQNVNNNLQYSLFIVMKKL